MNTTRMKCLFIIMLMIACNTCFAFKTYWVGGSGNWSDVNHWSLTSGGAPSLIGPGDSVYFDANSFTAPGQVVTVDHPVHTFATAVDFTGAQFSPHITGTKLIVNGSVQLTSAMTWDSTLRLAVNVNPGDTIKIYTAGVTIGKFSTHLMHWGMVELLDPLNVADVVTLDGGGFHTNGFPVTCKSFSLSENSYTDVDLDTSIITTGSWSLHMWDLQSWPLNVQNARIIIDHSSGSGIFVNDGYVDGNYNSVICKINTAFSGDTLYAGTIELRNHAQLNCELYVVDTLIFNNGGFITSLGNAIHINGNLISSTTAGPPAQLSSSALGYIYKAEGTICIDYMLLQNIVTVGGAHFYAGAGSTDLGGNQGWIFDSCGSPPPGYYWVGGTGNWSDLNHWAASSGGTTFHTVLPDGSNDIYIDQNSFTIPGETLTVDTTAYVANIYFHPSVDVNITKVGTAALMVASIDLNSNVLWSPDFTLGSTTNFHYAAVRTGGSVLPGNVAIHRGELLDDITVNGRFDICSNFANQRFRSNDYTITCDGFYVYGVINLGSSTVYCNTAYFTQLNQPPSYFLSDVKNSTIILGPDSAVFNNSYVENFGTIIANGEGIIHAYPSIQKLIVNSNVMLDESVTIDTLLLNNPGDSLVISTGKTVTIKKLIASNGNIPDHTAIVTDGGLATISKASGDVCLHFTDLQNITATGGAQFFADSLTCNNFGGNTGWQFIPCSVVSDVWPGDANYDGVVNNADVLNIGLAFNESGPLRSGASLAYVAQPATDWLSNFTSAVNKKHADTDGSGVIDLADTAAIYLNYGLSHPLRTSALAGGPLLYIELSKDSALTGDTVQVDFYLGTSTDPVDSIYGIAFSMNFDNQLVDTTYVTYDYSNSWMGLAGTDLFTFQKPVWSSGRIDFAITRIDHDNVSGSGHIGSCGIVIVDNIGARIQMPFSFSNVTALTKDEYAVPVQTSGDTLGVTINVDDRFADDLMLYPNPVRNNLRIVSQYEIESIEIVDLTGKFISSLKVQKVNPSINVNLESGFYVARINTAKGTVCKKLQVITYKE